MEKKLNPWVLVGLAVAMAFIIYVSFASGDKVFSAQKADAKHLLSLNCTEKCFADGEITYLGKEIERGTRRIHTGRGSTIQPYTYSYEYSFKVNNTERKKKVKIYTDSLIGIEYLPSAQANIVTGEAFPEKIMYDPNKPSVSLPAGYVKVIVEQKGPRHPLYQVLHIIAVLIIIAAFLVWRFNFMKEVWRNTWGNT